MNLCASPTFRTVRGDTRHRNMYARIRNLMEPLRAWLNIVLTLPEAESSIAESSIAREARAE
jgi:hypothetical protein